MKLRGESKRKMTVHTRNNKQRAVVIMQKVVEAQYGQICFLLLHFEFSAEASTTAGLGQQQRKKMLGAHSQIYTIQQN